MKPSTLLVATLSATLLLSASFSRAEGPQLNPNTGLVDAVNISYVGSACWAGLSDVTVVGEYAYCAMNFGLMILDISDPSAPTVVSRLYIRGASTGVAVAGDYAYVANSYYALYVIDVSLPGSPTMVAWEGTYAHPQDVVVVDGYAYVADSYGGLWIIDVTTPTNPESLSRQSLPGSSKAVDIQGDYVYVAANDGGLRIVDISTPAFPDAVGHFPTPLGALDVAVLGAYAFVCDLGSLHVVNISTPSNPVGDTVLQYLGGSIVLSGDHAYCYNMLDRDMQIIDVSIPSSPVLLGSLEDGGYPTDVDNRYAYSIWRDSMKIVDIIDSLAPTVIGAFDALYHPNDLVTQGDFVFIADSWKGLLIVDISNLSEPSLYSSCQTPSAAVGVALAGDTAFIADRDSGLQIIDISNLQFPTLLESYKPLAGSATDVVVADDIIYFTSGSAGLWVANVHNLDSVGVYDTPGDAQGVAIVGDMAYVADGTEGLCVVNITDIYNPTFMGKCDSAVSAADVSVANNIAYVACEYANLRMVDVSVPSDSCVVLSVYEVPYRKAKGLAVGGEYVFLVNPPVGFEVINVSDPYLPVGAGLYTPSSAEEVVVDNGHAFLAEAGGLLVMAVSLDCSDVDGDWVCESSDNCPDVYNPAQEDYDQDGIGDSCDACNDFPPVIAEVGDTVMAQFLTEFRYYPEITDPDNDSHTIIYTEYPHWCLIQNDTVVGIAPDTVFVEPLTAIVQDTCNADTVSFVVVIYLCGDVNADQVGPDISDLVYLIDYMFQGGPPPPVMAAADVDASDDPINISDLMYLIDYMFTGGPPPVCP